jgi:hypothetical protein
LKKRETGWKVDKEGRIDGDVINKYFNMNDEPALEVGRVLMGTNPPSLFQTPPPEPEAESKENMVYGTLCRR